MDDTRDSFGIVSRCRFISNGIRCLKIKHHLRLFIAVWHSCYVTIFNCIDEKNKALFKEQTVEKDDLKFSHPIINIFMTNHCIYAADSIGTIYDLHYRVHHLDEAKNRCSSDVDMFDLSPGCLFGWVQSKTGILSQCDTLLAISAFKEKFIAISVFSENLLGHVYMLDTFCCLYTVTLLEAAVDKVVFTCIDVPLSEELKQQYFPFLNENDVEIPVIGLNCGQALAFSITQQSDQAHTVFSSLQPIVAIDYNFDKELQKCSSILVLVSSGLLIMLTGKSSQLLYISAPVYIALFNRNQSILVSSDGADFMLAKIKFDDTGVIQESSIKSKVKASKFTTTGRGSA
ncbi:uncharacterized protein LOC142331691 [Lycorma delicatula]|uniref:uncharacterized protein LOC142328173 n=1 Tax=Lycorma delicatula TaxID=130591 RepID=UPI003F510A12